MRCSLPLLQRCDGLGNQPYHLLRTHNTQMPVRDQGQRPPSLVYPTIQDNGPRLSDTNGTTGEHTGAFVQLGQSQRRIVSQRRHPVRNPVSGQIGWNHEPDDAILLAGLCNGLRQGGIIRARHYRLVVDEPVDEVI